MNNEENIKLNKKSLSKNWKLLSFKTIIFGSILIFIFSVLLLKLKFHINIIVSLIISVLITLSLFTFFIRLYKKRIGSFEFWHDLYGQKYSNIPYYQNEIIINSFKKNGDNFNEEIGEINNGEDYNKNERNYYDIFIPYSSLKNKKNFNAIILFIHGGAWRYGDKEHIEFFCSRYAKYGYITASMNHTYLNKKYKDSSIFKILDEITSCINNIKFQLKNEGFDENKLEMAIGGISSGAHLASLYAYSIKSPIQIKFVINLVGPLSLEPEYWYKIKENNILENIEPKDIENALNEKKIINIFKDESNLLNLMNSFIGNKFSTQDIRGMIENKKIKLNNEKYKEMFKIAKNTFPTNFINSNTVPTLCKYGGKDSIVGIAQYSYLKKLSEKYGNTVELVYMKDGGHMLDGYNTIEGINSMREMHYKILNFANKYFISNGFYK